MKSIIKIYSALILILFFNNNLSAQTPYYVTEVDKILTYIDPRLETLASAIGQSSPLSNTNIPLKVYSYNLYPIMGAVEPEFGLEASKIKAIENLESKDQYLGIIKEIINEGDPTGAAPTWKVRFTVILKLPENIAGYAQIDELEKEALKNLVQSAIENKYNNMLGFEMGMGIAHAEIEGLEVFQSKLEFLMGGGTIPNIFESAGFEEVIQESPYEIEATSQNFNTSLHIYDYSGLKIKNSNELFVETISYVPNSEFDILGRPAIIITSNLSRTLQQDISNANNQFNTLTEKSILWYHFKKDGASTKVFIKSKLNITEAEFEALFSQIVTDIFEEYENAISLRGSTNSGNRNSTNCNFDFYSLWSLATDDSRPFLNACSEYSFKECKLNSDIPSFLNDISLRIANNYNSELTGSQIAEFYWGLYCGLADGFKDTMVLLGQLSYYAENHNPGTAAYWSNSVKKILKGKLTAKQLFDDIAKEQPAYHRQLIKDIIKSAGEIISNREEVLRQLENYVNRVLRELNGDSGIRLEGYQKGYILFEIILTVATEGAGGFKKLADGAETVTQFIIKNSKKLADNLKNISAKSIDDICTAPLKISKAFILSKIKKTDYPNLHKWVYKEINETNEQKLLEEIEILINEKSNIINYKEVIDDDLIAVDLGTHLKKDLKEAPDDLVEHYMSIKEEPGKMVDVAKENTKFEKYEKKKSGLRLSKEAKEFEDIAAFEEFKAINGLTDNRIVKQVTIEVNGIKVRFDFIGKDLNNKFYFGEAKFSSYDRDWNTSWYSSCTKNQKPAFTLIKDGNVNSLVVKATEPSKVSEILQKLGLNTNSNNIADKSIEFSEVSMQIFGSFANEQSVKPVVILKNHN